MIAKHVAGDHTTVGQVEHADVLEAAKPLLYFRGSISTSGTACYLSASEVALRLFLEEATSKAQTGWSVQTDLHQPSLGSTDGSSTRLHTESFQFSPPVPLPEFQHCPAAKQHNFFVSLSPVSVTSSIVIFYRYAADPARADRESALYRN